MRYFIKLIIFIPVVFLFQGCHTSSTWVKYSSNEDGFAIYMPSSTLKSVKQEQTAFGKQAIHYITWKPSTFDINKLKLLQVSYTDCPRRASSDSVQINATLDSSLNLIKKNYTELDIVSEHISIEGYPGRAFIYEDDKENSTTIVKEILANNRIYWLTAVAKKDYPTNNELNSFFDSFLVLR